MAPTRSLNVRITGDSRDFNRMVGSVDRDSDRLQKRFSGVSSSADGLSLRIGAVGGSLGQMLPLITTATPALVGLGGAAAAVGSSFAAAAAGAGALGVGLGASLAPILVVGKQVTSRFEEIKKGYEALQKAQTDHTAASKKAADEAMAGLSKSEQAMARSLGALSGLQQKVLGGASDRIFGALAQVIPKIAPAIEKLAGPFDRLGGAIANSIGRLAADLTSGPWAKALKGFIDSGTKLVGPMTSIFVHIGAIMRDIATAALPMVQSAVKGVADWFEKLDRRATTGKIREVVKGLVDQTKSWFGLFAQIGQLMGHVFGVGAKQGQGLVDGLTHVVAAVDKFVVGMRSGTGAGGKFAEGVKNAFERAKVAVGNAITAVRRWLTVHRADIQSVVEALKRFGDFAKQVFMDVLLPNIRRSIKAIGPYITGLADVIRGLVRVVSGLLSGDWRKAWDGAKETVSGAWRVIKTLVRTELENTAQIIRNLGPKLLQALGTAIKNSNKAVAEGMAAAIRAAVRAVPGLVADALSGLGHTITSGIQKGIDKLHLPFGLGGDGIGIPSGITAFGGGLMGARASMAPVAGIGSRFGLQVSSGRRPGAITSSGNVSYHSSGEALDEAGSPAGMAGFFNYMKNTMGGSLAELIYTGPGGGTGIKNGRPYTYTGAVAADHHDHVHVAIDTGVPGVGDGLGRFGATSYGPPWGGIQGTGVTATGVNLKANPHMYGVAVDPSVIPLGSKLRITPNPFNYGGTFTAFDTGGAIKGRRLDFYDWRGRSAQMGWGMKNVSVELVTGSSSGSSGSKTKTATAYNTTGLDRGGVGPVDYSVVYPGTVGEAGLGLTREQQFAQQRAGKRPIKGLTPAEAAMRDSLGSSGGDPGPSFSGSATEFSDAIRARVAEAALTADPNDDITAAQAVLGNQALALDRARRSGDYGSIADAAEALKSAQDNLKSLTEAITANTDALESARADLEKQRADDAQRALAVSQSQYGILANALWDAASQFGGARLGLTMAGLKAPAGAVGRL